MQKVYTEYHDIFWDIIKVLHTGGWTSLAHKTQPVMFMMHGFSFVCLAFSYLKRDRTRRPASADRTARRQFQATGQPVSRMQASDAMTSRLPRNEAKCVQRRCFQCGSVALRSDIKGMELPPANLLIPLERQLTALQLCRWEFLYNETLQQTIRPLL